MTRRSNLSDHIVEAGDRVRLCLSRGVIPARWQICHRAGVRGIRRQPTIVVFGRRQPFELAPGCQFDRGAAANADLFKDASAHGCFRGGREAGVFAGTSTQHSACTRRVGPGGPAVPPGCFRKLQIKELAGVLTAQRKCRGLRTRAPRKFFHPVEKTGWTDQPELVPGQATFMLFARLQKVGRSRRSRIPNYRTSRLQCPT